MPGNWRYSPVERGGQSSQPIQEYGIGLWMGFRFDRRDADWDVDKLELPSPAVTVFPHPNGTADRQLPQPPEHWSGPVEGMGESDLWVRQPVPEELPRHGDPLDEYYRNFFCNAFSELKKELEFGQ